MPNDLAQPGVERIQPEPRPDAVGLSYPPTCAYYVNHLHHALRELIGRAERLGSGLPGYPSIWGRGGFGPPCWG